MVLMIASSQWWFMVVLSSRRPLHASILHFYLLYLKNIGFWYNPNLSTTDAYDDTEFQGIVDIFVSSFSTRVVQKLIETLKTWPQISLVVSALEPGFLTLIKDFNGNHVVQHCLQWLSNEHNKFIFVVAAKYCVDIATHQHGCCVLQRCIGHSSGEHREKTGCRNMC
ncbi:unnamed protein product [Lupinus luteus]|uniref:PUM-HD domain-containing protein n=1 Tax=Lupinus luteus TaxID=3873 RepID=A0AAV1W1S8_LUPLU